MKRQAICLIFVAAALLQGQSGTAVIHVDAAHPGPAMSPGMFGVFFEDINFGADGGLYPELIKNRSFEFSEPLYAWHEILATKDGALVGPKGELDIRTDDALNVHNPHYLRIKAYEAGFGLTNAGYRGIALESGAQYRFSAYVRSVSGVRAVRASISDENGKEIEGGKLEGFDEHWKKYETVITASATTQHGQFSLLVDQAGAVDVDMVSLFPVDTWKQRPNGLRKDLVQLLHDMHPGFIRFPGGCIVEGRRLATRYRWKNTIGDPAERQTIVNRWNDEFDHRPTPDYFQSFGLGFYEYFQLAEDIGAQPLPILNCGMACEFNSGETAALAEINEYVQDALDLIEFANGAVSTPWGKLRAQMGHPEPFHLTMIGVGNEQWGPRYLERYKIFEDALKTKHPEIALIVSAGPSPAGEEFDRLWSYWRTSKADLVDEHYYMSPEWFLANAGRYDHYDRSGPKVFAGEYAAQTSGVAKPDNRNNWHSALAEAAFMTGLERNGDLVKMASYAPLLAHVDAWQWTPDAIWFDGLRSYGTPNYYVQRVFASNTGTRIIPVSTQTEKLYAAADFDERTKEVILKVVNAGGDAQSTRIDLGGMKAHGRVDVTTLAADSKAENSLTEPTRVAPQSSSFEATASPAEVALKPYSLTVFRFKL